MDSHEIAVLSRHFEKIGARLRVDSEVTHAPSHRREPYTLDVQENKRGSKEETYLLRVRPAALESLQISVLDVQPQLRHLLLMARPLEIKDTERPALTLTEQSRLLCGHDERHWFVAAVKNGVGAPTGVAEAMESLKPAGVAAQQYRAGVRAKDWHRRKNAGFVRQGEWFFLPEPDLVPSKNAVIYSDEPIRRSSGNKPHIVEELIRDGGDTVYVCDRYSAGVSEARYQQLLKTKTGARAFNWRPMRRNPDVYARGRVRHADHATLFLPCWHRVRMNGEILSAQVAFLD
ncbi:MAG: hypothetical protein H8F28_08705 [Fibrella sp.]|nr:hypothetical protein [Armatimonadota bacterium]